MLSRSAEDSEQKSPRLLQTEQAISLASTAAAQRTAMKHPISPAEHDFLDRWLAPARRILGEDRTAVACSAGATLSIEEAIALAAPHRTLTA